MALIVEDGTGKADADSYVSLATVADYATSRGKLWAPDTEAQGEAACRVASAYIDDTYRFVFQGSRTRMGDQAMEWPRSGVFYSGINVAADKLPKLLVQAVCEAAIREVAKPGCLVPDVSSGSNITSLTADSVSVTFGGGGLKAGVKAFGQIGMLMAPLLQSGGGGGSSLSGSTGRG